MSTNFNSNKPKFFKDNQKRTRVIGHSGASNQTSTFVEPSRTSAIDRHNSRLLQRIPKQVDIQTKTGVNIRVPERTIELKLVDVDTEKVIVSPREGESQEQFDRRAQVFVDKYKHGELLPPPLLHKLPDGTYDVVDGKARARAYQLLKVKKFPANENGILDIFNNSRYGTSHSLNKVEGVASSIGKIGEKASAFAAKKVGHSLGKVPGVSKTKSAYVHKFPSKEVKEAKAKAERETKLFNDSRTASINARAASQKRKLDSIASANKERLDNLAKARKAKADNLHMGVIGSEDTRTHLIKSQTYASSSNGRRERSRSQRRR